jgi:hypothetical protein
VAAPAAAAEPPFVDEAVSVKKPMPALARAGASVEVDEPSYDLPRSKRRARPQRSFNLARVLVVAIVGAALTAGIIVASVVGFDLGFGRQAQQGQPQDALAPLPPPPRVDAAAEGPAPADIAANVRRQAIRATVRLRVTRTLGLVQQGSGFFAAEPGLVITNAHVVGMGASGCHAPENIEVTVNAGEPEEHTLNGQVVAADWNVDLAVVRVLGDPRRWPAPLPVAARPTLAEEQKLFVLGHVPGGKTVNVSESRLASLQRDDAGAVASLQFAGLSLAASGGPVIDTRGVVAGVAVTMIQSRPVNFAVPAEKLHGLLRGAVKHVDFGEAYLDQAQTRLPVTLTCVDPLQRVRDWKVEVWTGKPGGVRPASFDKPAAVAGDGPRQSLAMDRQDDKGFVEFPLPTLTDDVLWLQPALTDLGGTTRWGTAIAYKPSGLPPVERTPARLQVDFAAVPQRTLHLSSRYGTQVTVGEQQQTLQKRIAAQALELAEKTATGGELQVTLGSCQTAAEVNGRAAANAAAPALLRSKLIRYVAGADGAMLHCDRPNLPSTQPTRVRLDFNDIVNQIANGYEATCMPLPNRLVQPLESWETRVPILLANNGVVEALDLMLSCRFEGCRSVDGETQAVISLSGSVHGGIPYRSLGGSVSGKSYFSLNKGYVSQCTIKVATEFARGNIFTSRVVDVTLERSSGNTAAITPTKPVVLKRGKTILQATSQLTATDNAHLASRRGCFVKTFTVHLSAGQPYIIEMNRHGVSSLDPFLLLQNHAGTQLAEDDDEGGNLNARILYTPEQTGVHQICATSCNPGQVGAFLLAVSEEEKE